jgi:hypothetical protein
MEASTTRPVMKQSSNLLRIPPEIEQGVQATMEASTAQPVMKQSSNLLSIPPEIEQGVQAPMEASSAQPIMEQTSHLLRIPNEIKQRIVCALVPTFITELTFFDSGHMLLLLTTQSNRFRFKTEPTSSFGLSSRRKSIYHAMSYGTRRRNLRYRWLSPLLWSISLESAKKYMRRLLSRTCFIG